MENISSSEGIQPKGLMLGDLCNMQVIDNNDTFFKKEGKKSFIDQLNSPGKKELFKIKYFKPPCSVIFVK